MSILRMLQRLPRMLTSGQVILVTMLLGNSMGVRSPIMQFRRPLVILIM
jgi:hypothetical protein